MPPASRRTPPAILAVWVGICLFACGDDPHRQMTESVVLVSASPDTGASLWAGSGLKLSYRWGAGIASEPKSAVFIALEFDRKGGGVVSCPVAGPMVRREGGDSAFLFLTGLTKSLVAHPSTARLVLSETIEDSLVTVLAKSPVLSWKD